MDMGMIRPVRHNIRALCKRFQSRESQQIDLLGAEHRRQPIENPSA
jgi:hypothetical protein